jgi:uncharacterized protein YjbJ (UPF0337 family)
MSIFNKAKNKAQAARGQVKDTVGKVTNDSSLQAEGRADKMKSDLKQAGEKVKDAFDH